MNIEAEKIALIKLLADTNNPETIQSVKQIFEDEKLPDIWDTLSPDQQTEIHKASLEVEQGQATDYEKFIAKHR